MERSRLGIAGNKVNVGNKGQRKKDVTKLMFDVMAQDRVSSTMDVVIIAR